MNNCPECKKIAELVNNPGSNPNYHYYITKIHRLQWPLLWEAIDKIIEKEEQQK